jgi:PAS domain S-box-containing protein
MGDFFSLFSPISSLECVLVVKGRVSMKLKKPKKPKNNEKKTKKQVVSCGCARPRFVVRLAKCLTHKEYRQHLRLLAKSWELVTDAISVVDPQTGQLLYVNGAWRRLYGYSSQMALGAQVEDLVNSKKLTNKLRKQIHEETLQGHWCGRLINRDAKGREFPVDLSTGLVNAPNGKLIGLLGVGTPLRGGTVTDEKINRLVLQYQETLSRELKILLESTLFNGDLIANGNGKSNGHVEGLERLSPREIEVFDLIGQGLSTVQISRTLKVSHYTIQAHRNHIRDKLDLRDSAVLTFRAYQWSRHKKENEASSAKAK